MKESSRRMESSKLRVRINQQVFTVDRSLAEENCEYFRALFQSGMRDSSQEEIQLPCVGVQGFLVLLQVLDGVRPLLKVDQIVEAVECTAFLQVAALTKHLISIINSENCLLMFQTAAVYGVWELSQRCALFIRDMYTDLQEQVQSLPTPLLDQIQALPHCSYMAVCSHSPARDELQDVQRTVYRLDEEQGEWTVLTQLPGETSTTMAGVAVLDNKLYIIGGVHDLNKTVMETGFCYNPDADSWSTLRGPQQSRYNFTLIGHEGCLYAVGGEYKAKPLSSVERYRLSKESWSCVSGLPCPAASVVSAVTMSRIFICLWRGKGATEIYEYKPEQRSWLLVTTLIRQHSYGLFMVGHQDNLYVMRNRARDDFLVCVMESYNLSTGQWTALSGQYGNSKGSLFTSVIRGDSVFTLSRQVTSEYTVRKHTWTLKREMKGFGRIGSIYTFLMRLPKTTKSKTGTTPDLTINLRDLHLSPGCPTHCPPDL